MTVSHSSNSKSLDTPKPNPAVAAVEIGSNIKVGPGHPLLLICGPCQIESREHAMMSAEAVSKAAKGLPLQLVFKSSYDKANRTSLSGKRGIGIEKGLKILGEIKRDLGLPVLTDVHSVEQAELAASVVDVLQTPAFLCRQTDFLIGVGKTGKPINVKKGQFLAPDDMQLVAEKIASTGNRSVMLCERGASFGYRDLVVDLRSLAIMQRSGYPVIFDATHSVQSMGGAGGASGGLREFVPLLARGAVAAGINGIFIEAHNDPDCAPSDGACMVPFGQLRELLEALVRIREAVGNG
jgi:2-dehydro-3-deoxyphosphooctonate aldolase (KDO 8-P synthase)